MPMQEERFVEVDGGRVQLWVSGSGSPHICMAGATGFAPETYLAPWEGLGTVVRFAPRGSGASSAPRDWRDTTYEGIVDDLEAVRRQLVGGRWLFGIGQSNAGFIGLNYALRYPEALSGLIVAATAPSAQALADHDSILSPTRPDAADLAHLRAQALAPDATPEARRRWAEVYYYRPECQEAFIHRAPGATPPIGAPTLLAANRAQLTGTPPYTRYDITDRLGEIRVPTLILHGRHDTTVPLRWGELLRDCIPDAELVVLEHSRHLGVEEEPEVVRAAVQRFVANRVDHQPAD